MEIFIWEIAEDKSGVTRVVGRSAGTLVRPGIIKALNASLLGKLSFAGISIVICSRGVFLMNGLRLQLAVCMFFSVCLCVFM